MKLQPAAQNVSKIESKHEEHQILRLNQTIPDKIICNEHEEDNEGGGGGGIRSDDEDDEGI